MNNLEIKAADAERVAPSRTLQRIPSVPDHELIRPIGRGSYGEVWLARNAVGTWRAIKVVRRDQFKDDRPYEREFGGIQKYEPISRTNEGLVDVLQIGRNDAEGYFYYIMELADAAQPANNAPARDAEAGPGEKHPAAPARALGAAFRPDSYAPKTLAQQIAARGRLPVDECLTLGLTLNMALAHLHRSGLIHRDVKPANIIFVSGVAKLADIGLVTELADAQTFVGTEGFVPPDGPNSRHADLYALGKVLYEAGMGKDRQDFPDLLTGGLGSDSESRALMELNEILLKACALNPGKRYQSAEEMNADLALLQSGRSVREKHALERRLKVTRRIAAAVVAIMVLGVVPYYLAIREARAARTEATRSRHVTRILKEALLAVRPEVSRGRDTALLRAVFGDADQRVRAELQGEPAVRADLLDIIGQVYADIGEAKLAESRLKEAMKLQEGILGDDDPKRAMTLHNLSVVAKDQGRWQEAESYATQSLRIFQKRLGPKAVEVTLPLEMLAELRWRQGDLDAAVALQKQALQIARNALGDQPRVAYIMDNLGVLFRDQGTLDEAEQMHRDALQISQRTLSPIHPDIASELRNLANVLSTKGNFKDAEITHKQGLELARKAHGETSKEVALALNDLGRAQQGQRTPAKLVEATETFEAALQMFRQIRDEPNIAITLGNIGAVLFFQGKLPEAESKLLESVDLGRRIFGTNDLEVANTLQNLAAVRERNGDLPAAEAAAEECLGIRQRRSPNQTPVFRAQRRLGRILLRQQKFEQAQPLLVSSYEGLSQGGAAPLGSEGPAVVKEALEDVVKLYEAWGKADEAARWRTRLGTSNPTGIQVSK